MLSNVGPRHVVLVRPLLPKDHPQDMPQFSGFDFYIEVEGKRVSEYTLETSQHAIFGTPVVSCWIPSTAGKEFRIALVPPPAPRSRTWYLSVSLDGRGITLSQDSKGELRKTDRTTLEKLTAGKCSTCSIPQELRFSRGLIARQPTAEVAWPSGWISLHLSTADLIEKAVGKGKVVNSSCYSHEEVGSVIWKYQNLDTLKALQPPREGAANVKASSSMPSGPSHTTVGLFKDTGKGKSPGPSASSQQQSLTKLPSVMTTGEREQLENAIELLSREKALKTELAELRAKREREIEAELAQIAELKRKCSNSISSGTDKRAKT